VKRGALLGALALAAALALAGGARPDHAAPAAAPDWLAPEAWRAAPADGVALAISGERDGRGRSRLRLDYDFQGHGGWAAARRALPVALPDDYEVRFELAGDGPVNHLEVKLVDPAGESVWWHVRREVAWPALPQPVRIKKRQFGFAWGPAGGGEPTRIGALEITVTAADGGRGTVWIGALEVVPRTAPQGPPPAPVATATAALAGHAAAAALDGDRATAWRAPGPAVSFVVDLGVERELGGLTLFWETGRAPGRLRTALSRDGATWEAAREVSRGGAPRTDLRLPEAEARFLRLELEAPAGAEGFGLAELVARPLDFGATANDFVAALARDGARGSYPRGFHGEQSLWTVVGVDRDREEGLLSVDGALELGERQPSLEPYLRLGDRTLSWADVEAEPRLEQGRLPIPTVTWRSDAARLEITALADGEPGRALLLARYRLRNAGGAALRGRLVLALRPFQVNPPQQFLNVVGGVAPIADVACGAALFALDGAPRVRLSPAPAECAALGFDEGAPLDLLRRGAPTAARRVVDSAGLASALAAWEVDLAPGAALDVVAVAPLQPAADGDAEAAAAAGSSGFDARLAAASERWRAALAGPRFRLPDAAAELERTLASSVAWQLVHRDGAALQPGSRAYARTWIRDGALSGGALLRWGRADVARDFADWFAGYLYPDGKVPCCVDRRGADPVPEHDSHGQYLHLVTEIFRYTGDRDFAERHFAAVARTVAYLDRLRRFGPEAGDPGPWSDRFHGLLPASISHEGYSAKPMHSYWDDFFAYRGLDDAAALAAALGRGELALEWRALRDAFRADLAASIARSMHQAGIDHLPGCAELADFDATSSTVAIEPGGFEPFLPDGALAATFARFHRELVARRDGRAAWDVYTPYELRSVGALVRLGERERAHELLDFYLGDRRPPAWNQWPEVVTRDPREPRFVGDLPHGWVAGDFLRAALDLFAYERRHDHALVLAAGIPRAWLASGEPVGVEGLATPWGPLAYRLERRGGRLLATVDALERRPPGGVHFAPPLAPGVRSARVDGRTVAVVAGALRLDRLPARIEIEEP